MKKLVLAAMLGLAATSGQASAFSLSNLLSGGHRAVQPAREAQAPVVLVQSSTDAVRIQQLEEEIRQLNGRVEEMSFQMLQMQEQMRKTQEDNEFRFQQLEKSQTGDAAAPSVAAAPAAGSKKNDEISAIIDAPPTAAPSTGGTTRRTTAPAETTLGSLEVDKSGAPVGATLNQAARNSAGLPGVDAGSAPAASDPTRTASLGNESDAYRAAYNHILSGDYAMAETEFSNYINAFPKSSRAADANFWLGEAQYSQGKYNESAKTFLNAHQTYANSPKAPEMLLKLGMSLAALDNRETACATLREVNRRYPNAGKPVQAKVASEVKRLGC
ncbi:tol-pal system protein YbgF [Rhizobium sp. CSW-27]|uniref:tol-pal system protein YbgF n=1 Tax=Rhizobium sp. CSW-27 TaxID=2839985 RepID=UPI001C00E94D|nr:tol-pal system protein YbgF [Rhizobium sp. CSW-27]MBT9369372.1 tol-pal system protein YbgF [Rhizobium sp. CSW-27]